MTTSLRRTSEAMDEYLATLEEADRQPDLTEAAEAMSLGFILEDEHDWGR